MKSICFKKHVSAYFWWNLLTRVFTVQTKCNYVGKISVHPLPSHAPPTWPLEARATPVSRASGRGLRSPFHSP